MATKYAQQDGDWSDDIADTTWYDAESGGSAVNHPDEGDNAIINAGVTITIDDAADATIIVGDDTGNAINAKGILQYLSTAGVDHILQCKGHLYITSGGSLKIGTAANPIPATRTFTIKLNYSGTPAEGKWGLLNYGEMILQGDPTRITVTKCLLNTDEAVNSVDLVSDVSTGWKDNDDIAIASTTRTWSQAENGKMNGDAVTTALTVDGFGGAAGGLAYAHSGTSPTQAEIINLTRNVKVTSHTPASYRGYVCCYSGSTSDVDYVEFYMIGYNTTYKHGIEIRTTAADATNFAYCSVWGNAASNYPFYLYTAQNTVIDNCVIYDVDEEFRVYNSTNNSITNNVILKITDYALYCNRASNYINSNVFTSCSSYGIYLISTQEILEFDNNIFHSNNLLLFFSGMRGGTINNLTVWRNNSYLRFSEVKDVTVNNYIAFGNKDYSVQLHYSYVIFNSPICNGDSSFPTTYGVNISKINPKSVFNDAVFSEVSGIKTAHTHDVYFSSNAYSSCIFKNSKLLAATTVYNIQNSIVGSYAQCEDFGQVQYTDKAWYKYGIVVRDSTTKKTNSYSTRFDYLWAATGWLEYELEIPVKDGESIVISAWLRKNAAYTSANRPKIKLSGMGITETEDQMSDVTDTWEKVTVSGTPTRTGMAKLTIMTYLTNAGASAWMDFDATGVTQPVLNTLTGDFWTDGHFSTILFDTGTITPTEFWKTLTADIDETGSFGNLFKDNIDAKISDVPSDVWDEILTGATHNIPTSAGRRVREIGAFAIHSGTAQAGNSHSITVAASASPSDATYHGIYNRNLIVITDNTGVGQTRTIVDYDAITKVVVVDRDWRISPDATTEYQIVPDDTPLTVDHGVARGGTNRTITIRTYAASDDDAYLCNIVTIIAGAGRGQARLVDSYDGTNKIVTICGDDWVVTPDTTSVYVMMPYGVACAACMGSEALEEIADCVWDEDLTTHATSNSAGWFVRKIRDAVDAVISFVS